MDKSNFDFNIFGSDKLGPMFNELSQIPKTKKTVYSIQINTDSDTSDEPCRCLENRTSYSGGESFENENEGKGPKMPVPKHIKRSIDTLQTIKERVLNSDKLDDEFSHFGKNIASQLRQLPMTEALNLQLEILAMLKEKREAFLAAKLDRSSSSSYTTEYTFEIQNTISKAGDFNDLQNTAEGNR